MKFYESSFESKHENKKIAYSVFEPDDGAARAILQISHGMCEYIGRYEHFAEFLTAHGFIVCGNDHLGHGRSAENDDMLGVMPRNGGEILPEDVHELTLIMKQKHPDLPYFLLGHSMGSFVARIYLTKYGTELDGAIIMGTGGPESPAAAGKLLAKLVGAFKGSAYRSKLIDKVAFGSYNSRFGKDCSPKAWLTRDDKIVARYCADKFCTYLFTVDAFYTLFDMLGQVSAKDWASKLPKDLPILVTSGEQDPVGNYGKGVRTVFERIKAAGASDVTLKMYTDDRHEILNELDRDKVYADILDWLCGRIKK